MTHVMDSMIGGNNPTKLTLEEQRILKGSGAKSVKRE